MAKKDMSDCCSSTACNKLNTAKHKCPVNNQLYRSIPVRTVIHHIAKPWELETEGRTFYFCDDPQCDVVYFTDNDVTISKKQLQTEIGIKENSDDTLICYCFGVTKAEANNSKIKNFVVDQTKQGLCSCETSNPSGKCCLKDFPKSLPA